MSRLHFVLALAFAHAASSSATAQKPRLDIYGDPLPLGAIHRLGTLRVPEGYPALSPDGKVLASAGDKGVQGWDAATGQFIRTWVGERSVGVAFSPDGRWLVTASAYNPKGLFIYDAQTGKLQHELDSSIGGRVAFSPDGKIVAYAPLEAELRLYDVATGNLVHNLGRLASVRALAYSPDGQTVAAVSGDDAPMKPAFLAVWECATGKRVSLTELPEGASRAFIGIAFQSDSRHVLVSASDLALYDGVAGKRVREVRKTGVRQIAADRAGKRAISATGEIWDLDKLEVVKRVNEPIYGTVAISADGTRAASSSPMRTWDVATGKALFAPAGHGVAYHHAAFTADGERIVTMQDNQQAVLVWDARTGRAVDAIPRVESKRWWRSGPFRTLEDGRLVLGWEIWDAHGKKRTPTLFDFVPKDSSTWPFSKIQISPDGKTAVDWNEHEGTRLWDVSTCKVLRKLCGPVLNQDPRAAYAFAPDSKTLAVTGGFVDEDPVQFRIVDVATGKTLRKLEGTSELPGRPCFSADGRWVVINRYKPGVEVWHAESGRRFRVLSGGWPFFSAYAIAPHGQLLVTTGILDSANMYGLVVFEIATGQVVCKLKGHAEAIGVISFAHDGRRFISGSRDNTALVWSLDELAAPMAPDDDAAVWSALAGDAEKAYPVLWALIKSPQRAVALADKRLQRDPAVNQATIERWLADLGNPSFTKRTEATQSLRSLGMAAWPAVKAALDKPTELEVRRRLVDLLDTMLTQPHPDLLRDLRVIQLLETLGTPEARKSLERVEQSVKHGPRAEAARSALVRIGKRAIIR